MDPISQGVVGATFAESFAKAKNIRVAAICGLLSALVSDLDILINSINDPLLQLEYHRHFTHSLIFIPIGTLIVSIFLWGLFFRKNYKFYQIYFFSFLGFATHGIIDAFTSYGTLLYWPFSNIRIAWNLISIVDPLFTIPLLLFLIISVIKKSPFIARIGIAVACLYLMIGYFKHQEIKNILFKEAHKNNHIIEDYFIDPTIGNNFTWRAIYKSQGKYYIYAIYIPYFKSKYVHNGDVIDVINTDTVFPSLDKDSKQRKDIKRFENFTSKFIAMHPSNRNIIIDLRYNIIPFSGKDSLWGIEVNPNTPDKHVKFTMLRNSKSDRLSIFWSLINGDFAKLKKYQNDS